MSRSKNLFKKDKQGLLVENINYPVGIGSDSILHILNLLVKCDIPINVVTINSGMCYYTPIGYIVDYLGNSKYLRFYYTYFDWFNENCFLILNSNYNRFCKMIYADYEAYKSKVPTTINNRLCYGNLLDIVQNRLTDVLPNTYIQGTTYLGDDIRAGKCDSNIYFTDGEIIHDIHHESMIEFCIYREPLSGNDSFKCIVRYVNSALIMYGRYKSYADYPLFEGEKFSGLGHIIPLNRYLEITTDILLKEIVTGYNKLLNEYSTELKK